LKYSPATLSKQLHDTFPSRVIFGATSHHKVLESLFANNLEDLLINMGNQEEHQTPASSKVTDPMVTSAQTNFWVNDTSVSTLSSLILEQLKKDQVTPETVDNNVTCYQSSIVNDIHNELHQRFRFNIIRH
jgi:hypothetical protein